MDMLAMAVLPTARGPSYASERKLEAPLCVTCFHAKVITSASI